LLAPLGIELSGGTATVPTWRPDVEREIDVVEEVARGFGLHRIRRSVPSSPEKLGGLSLRQRERRLVGDVLIGAGYDEVYTLPLLAHADLDRAGVTKDAVLEVENPLRAEESVLRPLLLPGLLRAVAHNNAHGNPDVALFELGRVFAPPEPGNTLPRERLHLAAARAGQVVRVPHEPDRDVSVYDITAVIEALAAELRLADWRLQAGATPGFHPARAAAIVVDGAAIGAVGDVDPEVVKAVALPESVVAFEVDVDSLLDSARVPRATSPISRFPASTIDLAFVVGEDVAAGAILQSLRAAGGDLLESVRVFDVFRAEALGPGKVSLAFALTFRSPDRTLTDSEVGELRHACIDAVVSEFGAELRT
jgi:phenylalanyl-tRNA synthetase beta chain